MSREIKKLTHSDKVNILSFLSILKENNILKWNKKLEIVTNGRPITNSNILNLIKHALKKKSKLKPVGMKIFYRSLAQINIPSNLLQNKKGILIMKNKYSEKENKFRPPGQLKKSSKHSK